MAVAAQAASPKVAAIGIRVPSSGTRVLHLTARWVARAALPPGTWAQDHGLGSGRTIAGKYVRTATLADGSQCSLVLSSGVVLRRTKPSLPQYARHEGTTGSLRWGAGFAAAGETDAFGAEPTSAAFAYRRAPAGLAHGAERWLSITMNVQAFGPPAASDRCHASLTRLSLAPSIRTTQLHRRRP